MTLLFRRLSFCLALVELLPVWVGGTIALAIVSTLTGRSAGDDVWQLCASLRDLTAREWPRVEA